MDETHPSLQSTEFPRFVSLLSDAWIDRAATNDSRPKLPVFLDLMSGPTFPLSMAFQWAGWKVLHPVDILFGSEFDLTLAATHDAVSHTLPHVDVVSCAMDCSTKSRIREIPMPGRHSPKPLRSSTHPRGAPGLTQQAAERVTRDNVCSDFALAVQFVMNLKNKGAFRENPRNSYHWIDPVEVFLSESDDWTTWDYDACCLFASRRKKQRIIHNISDMKSLPNLTCGHVHDEHEWKPVQAPGQPTYFPSKEEAEYTAHLCFTLVVCCSFWAAARGLATLKIQRLPPMQTSGDWRPLLHLDPSTFRGDAMPAVASFLGLRVLEDSPRRVTIDDVVDINFGLPPNHIYIGHGHFRHRLECTKWECPFVEGRDGSAHEVLLQYIAWLPTSPLVPQIPELANQVLVCDCQPNQFCHGDVLTGSFAQQRAPPVNLTKRRRAHGKLLLGIMAGLKIPAAVAVHVTQASLVTSVKNLFPHVCWDGVRWPLVEDLINHDALQAFPKWMNQQEYPMDGECGPQILDRSGVMLQRAASQAQSGAAARKSAIAPLVSFGLSPDEHFAAASFCQVSGSPLTWPPPLDCDLHFAAHCMAQGPDVVLKFRHENLRVFEELSRRLWPISEFLHSTQLPDVFGVNPKVHLCLIAVLVVLFAWPDTTFPHLLRVGFPAVGWIPPCGLWDSRPSPFMDFREVFHGSDHEAEELLAGLRPSADDQVAAESGQADELAGFCTAPMSIDELRRRQRPFRLIRRFVITQSSGKKRVIDDAAAGGQSRLSKDCNRLRFCSAVHPCLRIQALHKHIGRSPCDWPDTVSAGEDLPQAYRKIPMDPDHTWACIVVSRCLQTGKAEFRRYHGMLFGLPLAVTAFNRLPFFLQAVLRRTLAALCSFYFDDLTTQDWTSCAVHTQKAIQHVCELLGYPFATEKQQPPCLTNDFLGLVHDLSAVRSHGLIRLWIRPRLATKIQDIMKQALDSGTLLPGQASKLYGCLTFLDQGTFGHVARAGINSIKERQYSSERCLTAELQRAFNMIDAIFELQPRRVVELQPSLSGHLLAASDASQDAPRQGNAGVLLQTAYGFRCGTVITIDSSIFDLWSKHTSKIAQLELLAIVQGILAFPELFRSSSVVWYIDNVAALMSLVRGRSDNAELDFMSQLVHLMLFHLHCHSYWEWVQSKSNWSDGISREGFGDPWLRSHGFSIRRSTVPVYLWRIPFRALSRVCAFL